MLIEYNRLNFKNAIFLLNKTSFLFLYLTNKELFKFFLKLLTQFPMANIGIKYNIVTLSHPIKDGSSR